MPPAIGDLSDCGAREWLVLMLDGSRYHRYGGPPEQRALQAIFGRAQVSWRDGRSRRIPRRRTAIIADRSSAPN